MSLSRLFVYGTLMPGDLRWPHLRPFATSGQGAETAGRIYDTGWGYPAADFGGSGVIVGWLAELDPLRLDEALDVLDDIEGTVTGDYHRVEISVDGRPAWGYAFGGDVARLTPIPTGRWDPNRSF